MKIELVTTLKRRATKILAELHESKEPVLITEHGQPSAYLVDVDDYESMQSRIRILEGIARGEAAILENRVYSQSEAKAKMSKWLIIDQSNSRCRTMTFNFASLKCPARLSTR